MMIPFSSPGGNGCPPEGSPPPVMPTLTQGTNAGENLTNADSKTTKNCYKLQFAIPWNSDGIIHAPPILMKFLELIQLVCPTAHIASPDNNVQPITKLNEVPTDKKLKDYIYALQSNAHFKQFVFNIDFITNINMTTWKLNNALLMLWAKQNCYWFKHQTMQSNNIISLGFVIGWHPTFSNCNALAAMMLSYMGKTKFALSLRTEFFYKNRNCYETTIVEVQVDANETKAVQDKLANIFFDPMFLERATCVNKNRYIDFILHTQKGVMTIEAYCSALKKHHEYCMKTVGLLISGMENQTDMTPIKATYLNQEHTLLQMISMIKDNDGAPYFTSMEPMKDSETEGKYLLLTTKDKINAAKNDLNEFLKFFDQCQYNNGFCNQPPVDSMHLCKTPHEMLMLIGRPLSEV